MMGYRKIAAAALLITLLAACSTIAPKVFFYTLDTEASPVASGSSPSVLVLPAVLPELLDRPQWVLQASDGQVNILESRRWAEPLRNEIPRVIAGELGRQLDSSRVLALGGGSSPFSADYRLRLDVQRLDATLGKGVAVDILWRLEPRQGEVLIGRSQLFEPAAGTDEAAYEQLLRAEQRVLHQVAREIVGEIRRVVRLR